MAAKLFIDTWGWLTLHDKSERYHQQTTQAYQQVFARSGQIYTTDYVLDETFTFFFRRLPAPRAEQSMKGLLASNNIKKMIQSLRKLITFEEFVNWQPEDGRYELHNGVVIKMPQPLGEHEKITGFLAKKLNIEFDRLNFPYFIPKQALVKPPETESGYSPDVLILNEVNLATEPL